MPRSKPFRCHKCGQYYTSARCPDCYPSKKKSVRSQMNEPRGGGRARGRRVLGRGLVLPVLPYDHSVYTDDDQEEDE